MIHLELKPEAIGYLMLALIDKRGVHQRKAREYADEDASAHYQDGIAQGLLSAIEIVSKHLAKDGVKV